MEPEPYQSLYRRYRPQRFADVLGQEHVTRALRNAVRDGRVAHAYLFSGPRGTGKTSTARILAMALNCDHPEDGEPDGTCASCVAIRSGASVDVHELDAASNRRLDEMRDLLSRVALGTSGRQKVYIIDEVHQLTADASSALLKTLEEPPGHVVFVLATTDPQKVMPTIRSRTQHFEFHLLPADTLAGLLADVNQRANLGLPAEALDLVVRRGRGSARDALSALDQVAALGGAEEEGQAVSDIVDAIAEGDAGRVLLAVAEAVNVGRDPRQLCVELIEHLRNGFLALQARSLVQLADDAVDAVQAQANRLGLPAVVRAVEELGRAAVDMHESVDTRVTLEAALVRLASPAADASPRALLQRIERLEAHLAGGAPPPPARPSQPEPPAESRPAQDRPPENRSPSENRPPPQRQQPPQGQQPPPPPDQQPPPNRPQIPPPRPDGAPRRAASPPPPRAGLSQAPPMPGQPPRPDLPTRGTIGALRNQKSAPPEQPPGPAPAPTAGPARQRPTPGLPSRDELTQAWGDRVVGSLPPRAKVYFSSGRFVGVDGEAAIFALPDQTMLSRAAAVQGDAEAVLEAAFGRRVPLRLVFDDGAVPVAEPDGAGDDRDPSYEDFRSLEDAGAAVVSPEQRLLQAFPGSEEVDP